MRIVVTARADLSGKATTPGGMVHLLEVCKQLQALGHDLTLFVGSQGRHPHPLPFRVVYVPMIPVRVLDTASFPVCLFLWLLAFRLRHRCDLVYENTIGYSLAGLAAARLFRVPHAMHVHGFTPDELELGGHGRVRITLAAMFERWNHRGSEALFCVTPAVRERVIEYYGVRPERAQYLYNGVDAERCRPLGKPAAAAALGKDPSARYVGFIGYLFPWSGLEPLIDAAKLVLRDVPDARFVIVGHGLWGDRLPGRAADAGVSHAFSFEGYQPWERIPLYCSLFDVGVTPYVAAKGVGRYRSSMKSLEYAAAACPVIMTRAPGVSDLVEQHRCGLVIEPDDPAGLAAAILKLLTDEPLRRELGANGRAMVEQGYTWRHVAQRMSDTFEQLRAERSTAAS